MGEEGCRNQSLTCRTAWNEAVGLSMRFSESTERGCPMQGWGKRKLSSDEETGIRG